MVHTPTTGLEISAPDHHWGHALWLLVSRFECQKRINHLTGYSAVSAGPADASDPLSFNSFLKSIIEPAGPARSRIC